MTELSREQLLEWESVFTNWHPRSWETHGSDADIAKAASKALPLLLAAYRDECAARSGLALDYQRLFDQATTEVARLRDAGARMGRILFKLLHGIIETSPEATDMTDEGREANAARLAWDAVVSSPTPSVAPFSLPSGPPKEDQ